MRLLLPLPFCTATPAVIVNTSPGVTAILFPYTNAPPPAPPDPAVVESSPPPAPTATADIKYTFAGTVQLYEVPLAANTTPPYGVSTLGVNVLVTVFVGVTVGVDVNVGVRVGVAVSVGVNVGVVVNV
jgi:hypothetical protein